MGTINSDGIFVYDDTESLSPLSSYMNLQGSALSTRLTQDVRFKKVTNEAARTAYVNEVGIANISAANPLAVHRQNAPEGLRFEVTYNGTTWRTLADKEYYDSLDTGWVDLPVNATNWTVTNTLQARSKNGVTYIRGILQAKVTNPSEVVATGGTPSAVRPEGQNPVFGLATSTNVVGRVTVGTNGSIIYAGTLVVGNFVYFNSVVFPQG